MSIKILHLPKTNFWLRTPLVAVRSGDCDRRYKADREKTDLLYYNGPHRTIVKLTNKSACSDDSKAEIYWWATEGGPFVERVKGGRQYDDTDQGLYISNKPRNCHSLRAYRLNILHLGLQDTSWHHDWWALFDECYAVFLSLVLGLEMSSRTNFWVLGFEQTGPGPCRTCDLSD